MLLLQTNELWRTSLPIAVYVRGRMRLQLHGCLGLPVGGDGKVQFIVRPLRLADDPLQQSAHVSVLPVLRAVHVGTAVYQRGSMVSIF